MYRKCCELGLQAAYRDDAEVRLLIKSCIALPLLPAERIREGFNVSIS